MISRRRFLTLSAACSVGTSLAPASAHAATWSGVALGADVSVTLSGPRAMVDTALARLPGRLDAIEAQFSLFRQDSALSGLNATGGLRPSSDFWALMMQVTLAHRLTGGLFDPTVQPLWQALAMGHDPAPARTLIGFDRLSLSRDAITLNPGQALTLNGIAQGFATDLIRADLAAQGFDHALIDIGEQAALGGPFRLSIEDPNVGPLGIVTLRDASRATSSPLALRIGTQAHILGPQGEVPLWSTVSIECVSATLADALSTAAVFMPVPRLQRLKSDAALQRITLVDADGNLRSL